MLFFKQKRWYSNRACSFPTRMYYWVTILCDNGSFKTQTERGNGRYQQNVPGPMPEMASRFIIQTLYKHVSSYLKNTDSVRSQVWTVPIVGIHTIQSCDDMTGSLAHHNDVIMGAMASQITSLVIGCSTVYSQIKENIKAPRHWPLCEEFTGDRWIPRTNGQ